MWWKSDGVPEWGLSTHKNETEFFFFNIFVLGYLELISYQITGNTINLELMDSGFFNIRQLLYKLILTFTPNKIMYKYCPFGEEDQTTEYIIQDRNLVDYVYMLMRKVSLRMSSAKRRFHWMNIVHKTVRSIPTLATISKAAIPLTNGESYLRRYVTCPFDLVQKVFDSGEFHLPWPKVARDFYYTVLSYNIGIKSPNEFNRNKGGIYTYKYPFFGKFSASANAYMLPRILLLETLICHKSTHFQKAAHGLYNGAKEDFRFAFINYHKSEIPQQLLYYTSMKTSMAMKGHYDPSVFISPMAPQFVPQSTAFGQFDERMIYSTVTVPVANYSKIRTKAPSLKSMASEAFVVKFALANIVLLSRFMSNKEDDDEEAVHMYRPDLLALEPEFVQIRKNFESFLLHSSAKNRYTRVDMKGQAHIFADDWVLDFVSDVIDSHGTNSKVDMFYLGEIYGECSYYWDNLSAKSVKELDDWDLLSL